MARTKEVHFFDRAYERGLPYYESFFDNWRGEKAVGEATPGYLHGQYTAEKNIPGLIHRHLPDVKLIASLRNPVERVYSEFWNGKAKDPANVGLSFEDKLARRPEFIRVGFYYEHLQRFLALFPREHLLIMLYEDLGADPRSFMRRIYSFLDVDPHFRSTFETARENQTRGKLLLGRSRTLYFASRALVRLRLPHLANRVQSLNGQVLPQMNPETRRRLAELYRPHNERLERLIGRDLSHWNAPAEPA